MPYIFGVELYTNYKAMVRAFDPLDYTIASDSRDHKARCGLSHSLMMERVNPDFALSYYGR